MNMEEIMKQMREDMNTERSTRREERLAEESKREEEKEDLKKKFAELGEKIEKAIDPVLNRLEVVEANQEAVNDKLSGMEDRMKNLEEKEKRKDTEMPKSKTINEVPEEWPGLGEMEQEEVIMVREVRKATKRKMEVTGADDEETKKAMKKAAKTLSFFPIPYQEVETIRKELEEDKADGVEDDMYSAALKKALGEFVMDEMAMRQDDWDALEIREIFTPRGTDWRTVYLEVETEEEADWVKGHTRNMRKEGKARVGHHVPWQARERQSGFESKAKLLRDLKYRTRINIRDGDYVLKYQKRDLTEPWKIYNDTSDIPGFSNRRLIEEKKRSPKQAVGRKMRTNITKHVLSPGSKAAEQPDPKKKKSDHPNTEEEEEEEQMEEVADAEEPPEENTTRQAEIEDERRLAPTMPGFGNDRGNFTAIESLKNGKKELLTGRFRSPSTTAGRRSSLSSSDLSTMGTRSKNSNTRK